MGVRVFLKDPTERELAKALRKLKKSCEREGLMREYRRHEYYEKPSEARRRKRNRAVKFRENSETTKSSGQLPNLQIL